MRHLNPWVLWPVVIAGIIGGVIGWIVTSISCQPAACVASSAAVAVAAAVVSALGVGVVAVLALRSLAEWRDTQAAGLPAPEVGCEVPPEGDLAIRADARPNPGTDEPDGGAHPDSGVAGDQARP